ncbi:hypothetical protein [Williamsia deligens]|uniref:Uncharacterized protein n=2 Tax=Williamsia deligens TaxID=321325 RepID=A0ABW3G8E9_9NOCA|nr:hypothetical protein [Williamsia deligens]
MYSEPMAADWQFLELVIKNFGQTPAYDIEVHLDTPPEVSPDYEGADITTVAIPQVVPILAPFQEWRALWDHAPSRLGLENIRSRHVGHISYRGDRKKRQHWYKPFSRDYDRYSSPVDLNFNMLKDTRRVDQKTIHDVAKILDRRLDSTADQIAKIATTVQAFSRSEHNGVWVYLADADKERDHRQAEARERAEESRRTREWADSLFQRPEDRAVDETATEVPSPAEPDHQPSPTDD